MDTGVDGRLDTCYFEEPYEGAGGDEPCTSPPNPSDTGQPFNVGELGDQKAGDRDADEDIHKHVKETQINCAMRRLYPSIESWITGRIVSASKSFKKSMAVCDWIERCSKTPVYDGRPLDQRECLAYLEMNSFSILKAHEAIIADLKWSQNLRPCSEGPPARPNSPAATSERCAPFETELVNRKKTKGSPDITSTT